MADTGGASKVSAPPRPPTISLPPRSSFETLLAGGPGLSPGPMTLVSNFFSEQYPDTDCRTFSQLLAGAMASPVAPISGERSNFLAENNNKSSIETNSGDGSEKNLGFKQNRPMNLVVAHSPLFMIPSGLSPSGLLNSPGFFSPQSPFGMSHQQALAHVTAQAALSQSYYNIQAEYQPSAVAVSAVSPEQPQMPILMSDQENSQMESPEVSHSDKKSLSVSLSIDKPANDGYNWRKYGQKQVKASEYPRSYYKCTQINCPVKKKVGRSLDGRITDIIYKGQHNHEPPQQTKRAKEGADVGKTMNSQVRPEQGLQCQQETSRLEEVVPSQIMAESTHVPTQLIDLEETDEAKAGMHEGGRDEPNPKRRNTEVSSELTSSHKTVTEARIVVQTRSEVDLLDDGYKWRKYGQKVVKGNSNPRSYYKCTYMGCNVRKHVERAPADPKAVVTTYEGKHNHDIPTGRNRSHITENNGGLQAKPEKGANAKPAARYKEVNFAEDQMPVLLQLKEEQITA